jgi:hypothetical protein
MTLRRIQVLAIAVVLSTLLLPSGVAQPAARTSTATITAPAAKWTWQGCWTQFSAGTCRDIYSDDQGNYYICKECGTTGNPGPSKCNPISQATLASGFWCS